jgi:hypothetical protein
MIAVSPNPFPRESAMSSAIRPGFIVCPRWRAGYRGRRRDNQQPVASKIFRLFGVVLRVQGTTATRLVRGWEVMVMQCGRVRTRDVHPGNGSWTHTHDSFVIVDQTSPRTQSIVLGAVSPRYPASYQTRISIPGSTVDKPGSNPFGGRVDKGWE